MDWNKIGLLLHVVKNTSEHSPKYAPIIAAAQLELEEHLAEAKKIMEDKAKAKAGRLPEEDKARSAVGDATDEDDEPTPVRRI